MIQGMIGKKIGMTQIFDKEGNVVPVTIIKAGPCVVVQKKEINNKSRVQIGLVEEKKVKNVNKPMLGHFKKANIPPVKKLKDFDVEDDNIKVGDIFKVDIFKEKEKINIIGKSKGKGFQGVVKRYNFSGGRATHGSKHSRKPGSIGMCAYPAKVAKGKKMPGRTGGKTIKTMGLVVASIDLENNFLLVKGAVPGSKNSYVYILKKPSDRS
jgi:large subunit ribosomal protein L3